MFKQQESQHNNNNANLCISLGDGLGHFISYVHLRLLCRWTGIKHVLDDVRDAVPEFRIVAVEREDVFYRTRHFQKIRAGIIMHLSQRLTMDGEKNAGVMRDFFDKKIFKGLPPPPFSTSSSIQGLLQQQQPFSLAAVVV